MGEIQFLRIGGKLMRLVERDYQILRELDRWRFCLSRHVRYIGGFGSQSACDRRLRKLREAGLIDRKRIIYGVPSAYYLTETGRKLLGLPQKEDKIKLEQITHDIAVLDMVIYCMLKENVLLADILSEKQLHGLDGFATRKHRPDFVYREAGKKYCVEVELSAKSKERFEENLKQNFVGYDVQRWVVPDSQVKIKKMLQQNLTTYPNITILSLEEVESFVRNWKPES